MSSSYETLCGYVLGLELENACEFSHLEFQRFKDRAESSNIQDTIIIRAMNELLKERDDEFVKSKGKAFSSAWKSVKNTNNDADMVELDHVSYLVSPSSKAFLDFDFSRSGRIQVIRDPNSSSRNPQKTRVQFTGNSWLSQGSQSVSGASAGSSMTRSFSDSFTGKLDGDQRMLYIVGEATLDSSRLVQKLLQLERAIAVKVATQRLRRQDPSLTVQDVIGFAVLFCPPTTPTVLQIVNLMNKSSEFYQAFKFLRALKAEGRFLLLNQGTDGSASLEVSLDLCRLQRSTDSRLYGMETRMTNIETRMTTLETGMTTLETRMTNIETRMTNIETVVTELKETVTNQFTQIMNAIKGKRIRGNPDIESIGTDSSEPESPRAKHKTKKHGKNLQLSIGTDSSEPESPRAKHKTKKHGKNLQLSIGTDSSEHESPRKKHKTKKHGKKTDSKNTSA